MNIDKAINLTYNIIIFPFTAVKWVYNLGKEEDDDKCPKFSEIPLEAETDKIDAAWPPAPHPVDALSVHDLFRANGKLIRDLCYATTLSEEESQKFLLPVITNLAMIVHLTPASEYDHHQGYGGLFTHSLEVAYFAANEAKTTIFDRSASPQQLHQNKRRWILTAVLAALSHDIGKVFTDMTITGVNGEHWVQDEPILVWLRKKKIQQYFISFRPGRSHNEHKSASLANCGMLIPKDTFTFLGITGYGEQMNAEFRDALLQGKNGGLIGKILDNADGLSRRVDQLRQRKIRPEFKNVSHPQGDQLLKSIRVLIQNAVWTTNKDGKSRIFNTKQGCFILWSEEVVDEIREQASDMGFEGLPVDLLRLATVLVDAGAAIRNTDEISNTQNVFWRVTPIVLGNVQISCVRLSDPRLIFDATPPVAIDAIVEGLAIDDETKAAWKQKWKYLPVQKISREEEEAYGYTEEFVSSLAMEAEEHLREADELTMLSIEQVYGESLPEDFDQTESLDDMPDDEYQTEPDPLTEEMNAAMEAYDEAESADLFTGKDEKKTSPDSITEKDNSQKTMEPNNQKGFDWNACLGLSDDEKKAPKKAATKQTVSKKETSNISEEENRTESDFSPQQKAASEDSVKETQVVFMDEASSERKAVSEKSPKRAKSASKDDEVDIQYRDAVELVQSMETQFVQGFGIWLEGGQTTDLTRGCMKTSSLAFEKAIRDSGVDPDFVEMVLDKKAESDERPRIEWDQKEHQILLLQ